MLSVTVHCRNIKRQHANTAAMHHTNGFVEETDNESLTCATRCSKKCVVQSSASSQMAAAPQPHAHIAHSLVS